MSESSDINIPKKILELFTSDKRIFTRTSKSGYTPEIEVEGPAISWRSLKDEYQYFTIIPKCSCPPLRRPDKGFQETLTFLFTPVAPAHSDKDTLIGKLFWEYQKSVINDKGCGCIHIANWRDDIYRLDLLIGRLPCR